MFGAEVAPNYRKLATKGHGEHLKQTHKKIKQKTRKIIGTVTGH